MSTTTPRSEWFRRGSSRNESKRQRDWTPRNVESIFKSLNADRFDYRTHGRIVFTVVSCTRDDENSITL